jgi:hypothetical protein
MQQLGPYTLRKRKKFVCLTHDPIGKKIGQNESVVDQHGQRQSRPDMLQRARDDVLPVPSTHGQESFDSYVTRFEKEKRKINYTIRSTKNSTIRIQDLHFALTIIQSIVDVVSCHYQFVFFCIGVNIYPMADGKIM